MVQAIFFKEWLKIRWAVLLMFPIFVLVLVKITISMSYYIRLLEAHNYWAEIILRSQFYFGDLLYIPVLTGIVVAAFQFFPEIAENRLKLTLHLPMPENRILAYMTLFGSVLVLLVSLIGMVLLSMISIYFFPKEIFFAMWLSVYPWLLSSVVGYFITVAIFVEPVWFKRIILLVIGLVFVTQLLEGNHFNQYQDSLIFLTLNTLVFSIIALFPGYRFRKGVKHR